MSSPTLASCTFTGNSAHSGGGMYTDHSSPTVTNCIFNGNVAGSGGGGMLNIDSSSTVTNCTFTANTSTNLGGGMCNYASNPIIEGCVFSGNTTNRGGGMYNDDSSPIVTNCILWGDSPDEIYNEEFSMPTVTYSNVQGGLGAGTIVGGGNMDVDPVFVRNPRDGGDGWGDDWATPEIDEGENDDYGDLRLQSGSPCRNLGDPKFIPEPGETDLDGHARVLCGRVDMGAYEFGIGDYDCNDAVDLLDFSTWEGCMTGPDGGPYGEGCEAFDFDGDDDVDMTDFAPFVSSQTVE